MARPVTVWTIGHGTKPLAEFLALLRAHRIRVVADVRTLPRSRRNPHFSSEPLAEALAMEGIGYTHLPQVGGLRKPRPDSRNTAWKDDAFRGYADYMETHQFDAGLRDVLNVARRAPTALMCAEGDWRHCHRGLLADALKAAGVRVLHITTDSEPKEHPYTRPARIVAGRLTYASPAPGLFSADWAR
jgi:uncharacterized protein (DUF488 family)